MGDARECRRIFNRVCYIQRKAYQKLPQPGEKNKGFEI